MARREYTYSPQCVHEGCTERANYYFTTRRDQQAEVGRLRQRGGWRCVRHTTPGDVLSVDAPLRETVLESYQESYGRFWGRDGKGGSGFNYGPGFKAYAEDFPAGTRLIVTARVELPDGPVETDEEEVR